MDYAAEKVAFVDALGHWEGGCPAKDARVIVRQRVRGEYEVTRRVAPGSSLATRLGWLLEGPHHWEVRPAQGLSPWTARMTVSRDSGIALLMSLYAERGRPC
jgi:hypothetical protein